MQSTSGGTFEAVWIFNYGNGGNAGSHPSVVGLQTAVYTIRPKLVRNLVKCSGMTRTKFERTSLSAHSMISDMVKIMKGNLARRLFLDHPELKK